MLTLSRKSWMLKRLPPYSGIRLSTNVTFARKATSCRASEEPMNPRPPVIRTLAPEKSSSSNGISDIVRRGDAFAILFALFCEAPRRYLLHRPYERGTREYRAIAIDSLLRR